MLGSYRVDPCLPVLGRAPMDMVLPRLRRRGLHTHEFQPWVLCTIVTVALVIC